MKKTSPDLYRETIQRVRMQWTALIVVLALLVTSTVAFFFALFQTQHEVATAILGGFDVLLAFIFRQVYKSLFPFTQYPPSKRSAGPAAGKP